MRCERLTLRPERPDVTLTTYVLDESPELRSPRPAVLILPGGAYLGCSDREGEPIALTFAALGYHAFVLRYSTWSEGAPFGEGIEEAMSAGMTAKPHVQHPAPVTDVGRAMLAIRQRAEQWRVDADRIVVVGFSAGGHNAAMYGTHWHRPLLTDALGVEAAALRPAALVLGYPLADYTRLKAWMSGADEGTRGLMAAANVALLGQPDLDPATEAAVSPVRHVDAHTPPTFLWHTAADGLVPVQHTLVLATALADAGVPFEVHVLQNGGHGLALATPATATAPEQVDDDAATWFGRCARWLEHVLAPV